MFVYVDEFCCCFVLFVGKFFVLFFVIIVVVIGINGKILIVELIC